MNQSTIINTVSIRGIGLHSGECTVVKISPASVDRGINFFLNDGSSRGIIHLTTCNVYDTKLSTNIGNNNAYVSTIEHLLSVIHALSITNLDITIHGNEIPILDGSSLQYYHLLKSAGISHQPKGIGYIHTNKGISVRDGDSYIHMTPYDGLIIDMTIKFDDCMIGTQSYTFDVFNGDYGEEISPARTFCLLEDVQVAMEAGLIRGGSLDNAIVVDGDTVMNDEGVRFPDEFVRHKILDLIGDMYVDGPIHGYVEAYCSGHDLNDKLMKEVKKQIITC